MHWDNEVITAHWISDETRVGRGAWHEPSDVMMVI